jgi:hypothetical protein
MLSVTKSRDTLAELRAHLPADDEPAGRPWSSLLWIPHEGFTWRDDLSPWGDDPPGPFLVAAGEGRNYYEPLTRSRHTDIQDGFAALAEQHVAEGEVTDTLRDGILGYVDRFGFLLGVGQPLYPVDGPIDVDAPVRGESVTRWAAQLTDYDALHTAWTWASMPQAKQRTTDLPTGVAKEGADLVLRVGAGVRLQGRLHREKSPGAILEAVAYLVSERLSSEMRPAVRVGKPLRFQPTSLLGVIYLGFALRLGDQGPRGMRAVYCLACGNLFSQKRRDQRYCDATCRQKGKRMGIARPRPEHPASKT